MDKIIHLVEVKDSAVAVPAHWKYLSFIKMDKKIQSIELGLGKIFRDVPYMVFEEMKDEKIS